MPTSTTASDRLVGTFDEYPLALATRLASRFALPGPLEAFDFTEKGNINLHTFSVLAGPEPSRNEYLLQRINHQVFFRPRSVMAAMIASINAQAECLRNGMLPPGEEWEAITLIPTNTGAPYLELADRHGVSVWRLMERIPDTQTFKSLGEIADATERLRIAEEAGRGLARYGDFTADMDVSGLANPLPGYRDTRNYYGQLHAALKGYRSLQEAAPSLPEDDTVRQSTQEHFYVHCSPAEYQRRTGDPELQHYIALAVEQEEFGLTLLRGMEAGRIRQVAIHGDTKLDNFLFSTKTGRVKALVDLDTIMPHTWLADWGDTIRSLVNVAGEKEPDLSKIQVDMDVFRAVARGFLSTARTVTEAEVALMVPAVQILTLELGVRFLADYLRGDSYFRLGPADPRHLNKTRAIVQLRLFEKLREKEAEMRAYIKELRA
jgi:N-acetylhexosamine 1-kinase